MANHSYHGSLLGRKSETIPTPKKKSVRGIFREEPTPLLFADVDADYYLDIKQAAIAMGVTVRSIARYRVAKKIPCYSLGERKNLFRKSIIDRIAQSI